MVCGIGMRTEVLQRIFPRKRAAVPRLGFWILLFVGLQKTSLHFNSGPARDRKVCDAIGPRRPAPRSAPAVRALPPPRRRAAAARRARHHRMPAAARMPLLFRTLLLALLHALLHVKQPPVPMLLCLLLEALRACRCCRPPRCPCARTRP